MNNRETLLSILDLARWAPSGDNTQPWRFEIVADDHIAVHGFDTRDHVVYDFQGRASHMAHGALLETLRIAASGHGLAAEWSIREGCPDNAPVYDVMLRRDAALVPDPLIPFIKSRVTQRRPMRTTPLTAEQRDALAAAPGPDCQVIFFESLPDRWKVSKLLWANARIRLTCPEAYEVHREIIEWGAQFSEDRIPEKAVGVDPMTARLMKWVMHSWRRVEFFNRYLFGTFAPRVQLDLLPGLMCAAHVAIVPSKPPSALVDYVEAGRAMQRFWLTADAMGLKMQMEMTPVIFYWYVKAGASVSSRLAINESADELSRCFENLLSPKGSGFPVVLARVGVSGAPNSRSTRLSTHRLEYHPNGNDA